MLIKIWQIIYWLWAASEVGLLIITRTKRSTGETRDRGSLLLLWPVIFCSIAFASTWAAMHPHTMLANASPEIRQLLLPIGFTVLVLGIVIRWVAILSLGRSFSVNVAIHATQTVYRKGLYSLVRHPSYTGLLLIFFGFGIGMRNWVSLFAMVVFPTLALLYRIHVEEAALLNAFGPEYAQYMHSTKRLIPGIY